MKFFIPFFFASIISGTLLAQSAQYELIGTLEVDNQQAISFKLNFIVNNKGEVSGRSITDFYGDNQTTSAILGSFEPSNGSLSISEIENVSTKSDAPKNTFCYITIKNLVLHEKNSKTVMIGSFEGNYANGEKCAEGNVYLLHAQALEAIEPPEPDAALKEISQTNIIQQEPISALALKRKANTAANLSNGEVLRLNWTSDSVRVDIWDSYKEDNDLVNIYLNGVLTYENLEIKEEKKSIYIKVPANGLKIKLEAVNEGYSPPNTVNAMLINSNNVQPFVTKLYKGQSVKVYLKAK